TRLAEVPAMLVLAGRPDTGEWLTRFPSATTVRLGPLGRADALALVDALVCDRPPDEATAAALVDETGGNPLYLRELVAVLRDRGELDGDAPAAPLALPPSLRAVLAARLDAMAPAEKAAFQHLAVIGEPVTADQLRGFGLDDARAAVRALAAAGLVRHGADDCFDITDPLLREVAYEALPHTVRGERHR